MDYDAEFDKLIADLEIDPEIEAANSAVLEAQALLTKVEEDAEVYKAEMDALKAERAKVEEMLAEIARKMSAVDKHLITYRATWREANTKKVSAERNLFEAEKTKRVRFAGQQKKLDYLKTAQGKKWFTGVTTPDGRTNSILPQQFVGSQFLATATRSILGDGMGTGKTLQAIAALDLVDSQRALVIAQSDIANNFANEVRMWSDRAVVSMRGMDKMTRNILLDGLNESDQKFVIVVNFEAWRKDWSLIERLVSMGFDSIIIDEAHNIKDTKSIAYRGVEALCHTNNKCPIDGSILPAMISDSGKVVQSQRICTVCGWQGEHFEATLPVEMTYGEISEYRYWLTRSVKNIWCMTGTPILNKPQDLYAYLSLIDPTGFESQKDFLRRYAVQDPYSGKWRFDVGGADRLFRTKLKSKYLSRTLEDMGVELPEQFPVIHEVQFDKSLYPKQAEVIEQITRHAEIVMSSGKSLPIPAQIAIITRQRQANVWPGGITWTYVDPDTGIETEVKVSEEVQESMKIDIAVNMISEAVDRGERVVLFSQFRSSLAELQMRLDGLETEDGNVIRSVRMDGSTPDDVKEAIKHNFDKKYNEPKKWDVVLANYRVGGTGLNFTQARRTIVLDEEWNPGKRDQAYARTRRIGQDETTFVDVIRLEKTIDTWMARLIDEKEDMIGGFNESASDMQASWLNAFGKGEFAG